MTDELPKISGQGSGIFPNPGVLGSRDQSSSGTSPATATIPNTDSVTAAFSGQVLDTLGKAQARFVESSNISIAEVQSAQQDITDAQTLVSKQAAAAKALKTALQNGDQDGATVQQATLANLQQERTALAARVDQNNKDSSDNRTQNLSLNDDQKNLVNVADVQFSASKAGTDPGLTTVQAIDSFVSSLENDAHSLNAQAQNLTTVSDQITGAVKSARNQFSSIRKNPIVNINDAQKVSENVADALLATGVSAVDQTTSAALNSTVVSNLI